MTLQQQSIAKFCLVGLLVGMQAGWCPCVGMAMSAPVQGDSVKSPASSHAEHACYATSSPSQDSIPSPAHSDHDANQDCCTYTQLQAAWVQGPIDASLVKQQMPAFTLSLLPWPWSDHAGLTGQAILFADFQQRRRLIAVAARPDVTLRDLSCLLML